jgi:hypothetical protein
MRYPRCKYCFVAAALLAFSSYAFADPNTVIWDGAHLAKLRADLPMKDPKYRDHLKRLRKNAEISLKRGPYSVMDKKEVAASGDKHDYLSYARYWWPNPETTDGLPYIRRDGRTNEELLNQGDREIIGALYEDLETVALAGYLFNDDRYNDHAALLVRTWFLDPETRMNPHMKYGQAIPGRNDGRGSGIIDTRYFVRVLDAVRLLEQSNSWTQSDSDAMKLWMAEYLRWLMTSPAGLDERSGNNNHGTWFDAQAAGLALYVGERDLAKQIIEAAKKSRIEACIEPDGSQPEELERTKSLHYCVFNLSAMTTLARLGESVDVDLWSHESPDGRSIRKALDFVAPYLLGEKEWEHEQIEDLKFSPSDGGLFYMAAARYDEPRYVRAFREGDRKLPKFEYTRLLFAEQ